MTQAARRATILAHAQEHGVLRISQLAEVMGVSMETVRRDVRALSDAGEIEKLHGAIRTPNGLGEPSFERRMRENAAEKKAIAQHVAASIENGDSVMMDTGTTTSLLARSLLGRRGLTIVTNSSDVARTLSTVNGNKVYMAGGELHGDNGAAFGRSAIEFIASFRVRHSIISIGAISATVGPMDFHLAEAEFARRVLACGERRLIITDHSKFNRAALVKVCDWKDFDLLVSDRWPPDDIAAALSVAGTGIEIADA